jgi:hypothetical protein
MSKKMSTSSSNPAGKPSVSHKSPKTTPAFTLKRSPTEDKPHIQFHVVNAEKLLPARRGSVHVGEKAGMADRKPGLQVSMYLPTNICSNSHTRRGEDAPSTVSSMKRVYHVTRDFNEVTLNPQWATTFTIPLPCAKGLIRHTPTNGDVCKDTRRNQFEHENGVYGDNDDSYDRLRNSDAVGDEDGSMRSRCKALMNYWAGGYIQVKVVDGERFNEDIFMGEFTVLMSSFFVPVKGKERLEVGGCYALTKQNSKDRVSGSVNFRAFLYLPTLKFVNTLFGMNSSPSSSSSSSSSFSSAAAWMKHHNYAGKVTTKDGKNICAEGSDSTIASTSRTLSRRNSGRLAKIDDLNRCLDSITELHKSLPLGVYRDAAGNYDDTCVNDDHDVVSHDIRIGSILCNRPFACSKIDDIGPRVSTKRRNTLPAEGPFEVLLGCDS